MGKNLAFPHAGAQAQGLTFGSGDDLSLGWFEDLGGSDRYEGGVNSFGSGTEKGIGVFADLSGDDDYRSSRANGFGWIHDPEDWHQPRHPRWPLRSQGLFADGAGTDSYLRTPYYQPRPLGNGRAWMHPYGTGDLDESSTEELPQPVTYDSPNVFGLGLDR